MRTPVREAFSYGIRHGIRHIHCDSMKHKVILHWITMKMPYPVPYPVWKYFPRTGVHILPSIYSKESSRITDSYKMFFFFFFFFFVEKSTHMIITYSPREGTRNRWVSCRNVYGQTASTFSYSGSHVAFIFIHLNFIFKYSTTVDLLILLCKV